MSDNGGDVQANLHDDALSLGQRLAKLAIKRILAPLVVAGHISLDEAIEQIKLEVVAALADTGEANGFLAGHVSKSRSWFQDYLRKARSVEKAARRLDSGTAGDGDDAGFQLMSRVVTALAAEYPRAVGFGELRQLIHVPAWQIVDVELERRLSFFSKLGVIRIIGYERERPVVQAVERFSVIAARPGHIEAISKRMSWVVPLAQAYCQGKGDFGGFVGKLSPGALEKARSRLKEVTADILAEAIADTHRSDDPEESNVSIRVIIAIGEAGGFDE